MVSINGNISASQVVNGNQNILGDNNNVVYNLGSNPKELDRYASDLALVNLIGAWNEKNDADTNILSKLIDQSYSTWLLKAKEILHLPDNPFFLQNGIWQITDRVSLWEMLGSRIFDRNLDRFKELAIAVLKENDPAFELPIENRFAASIYGKEMTYSSALRKAMSEGLALIGSRGESLKNCSRDKAEGTAILCIREIFLNADWVLWGSLNELLPILAEAAPDEFFKTVESALGSNPCPFDLLFSQEGSDVTGRNYITGLLWALEGLAWDQKYLVRICVILGELSTHDPGGNWANRPFNTLSTILLPWYPQTIAPIEKRKVAVKTLSQEFPSIAWKLIITSLLPNQHQMSMNTHKPAWRNTIPIDWKEGSTNIDYWGQVSYYAELAVSIASQDLPKLIEIIDYIDRLPMPSFDRLIEVLSEDRFLSLAEEERLPLWHKIRKFTSKHRRFSKAEWSLKDDLLSRIEAVADKLSPSKPFNIYQYLFCISDYDLYEENGNWGEQSKILEERRKGAVKEILTVGSIELLIKFTKIVKSSGQVGGALGCISNSEADKILLPALLITEDKKLSEFISSYIWSRRYTIGWEWINQIDRTGWNHEHNNQFLLYLPFTKETLDKVNDWLGEEQDNFWKTVNVNPYHQDFDIGFVNDKLIEYQRPHAAINCLNAMLDNKQSINVNQCVKALISALSSSEPSCITEWNHVVELIKWLQGNSTVNQDDLFRIEWDYLALLDDYHGATPKLLENRLASDPSFFCEVIQLIYRSKHIEVDTNNTSEEKKAIAHNAWRLLDNWHTPPGVREDGSLDNNLFSSWLQNVKEVCTESGHLEVALITIGKALIFCPSDKDGLWIDRTVVCALNERDAEEMRTGFSSGVYNSRGAYWVDKTGKQEQELVEQYYNKAEDIENAGYHRFAVTLKDISEGYKREMKRTITTFN